MKRVALMASAALLALPGCSLGADEEEGGTAAAQGATKQVAATIEKLDSAVRRRDWRGICEQLFTSAARERSGGGGCARLVGSAAGRLRGARIEVVAVVIEGDRARARVRSRARGQRALTDTLTLKRVSGRYLIDSLS